jgi:hypothetical protein
MVRHAVTCSGINLQFFNRCSRYRTTFLCIPLTSIHIDWQRVE